ncbi:MAG: bifunctional phosphoribosylaminoimidazolecarboxamide formyltransferase/IMP cyclohydrolase [Ignavibacteriae bacterium]|nr:bifunctional phosphoribosylaminoimidazolecarboxamide formyltransferase/IMP cyclohydrolase [Ignavibacteriota bacterium]
MKKLALISVSNKENLTFLGENLVLNNYEILATGNTAKVLRENDIACQDVSDYTGFPEVFSGRVKTLHPKIFGGILHRRDNKEDLLQAEENNILSIDIVCVNLYPFADVVNKANVDEQTKIENIDIGGPSLIRAAAKNFKDVSVLTNPTQYENFVSKLQRAEVSYDTRKKLAAEAFAHTANYDKIIADYFENEIGEENKTIRYNLTINKKLRYGENPHQEAFLYGDFNKYYEVLHGKELSYNNIIDLEAAVNLVNDLDEFSCAIIKHTNPCGVATSANIFDAYIEALSGDPVSAFGGIVAFNNEVNTEVATKLNEIFTEIICAPSFSDGALEILRKKKNRRLVKILSNKETSKFNVKSITGGLIVQEKDSSVFPLDYKVVTKKDLKNNEIKNLKFAWTVCKHTKSNTIVFTKDMKAIGVGAGQMSRIDSSKIAVQKAKEHGHSLEGSVAASDAFFPFADGIEEIAKNGITAIVQPGGSIRDEEVIEAANNYNIAMIFSGIRNFKH